jgi:hypothetical protein
MGRLREPPLFLASAAPTCPAHSVATVAQAQHHDEGGDRDAGKSGQQDEQSGYGESHHQQGPVAQIKAE